MSNKRKLLWDGEPTNAERAGLLDKKLRRRVHWLSALADRFLMKQGIKGHIDIYMDFYPREIKSTKEALKEAMYRILKLALENKDCAPGAEDALKNWIANDATPLALAEWIAEGGYKKLRDAELKEALKKQGLHLRGRAAAEMYEWAKRKAPWAVMLFDNAIAYASTENGKPARWLYLLAEPWLRERAEKEAERIERTTRALPMRILQIADTHNRQFQWTRIPRALEVASMLGGPFIMNGETYAQEPALAGDAVGTALRPRGISIVPADWLGNPAQMTLALDPSMPSEALREYMFEATKTAHLAGLPNMTPKLLGFMFATAPLSGRGVKGTLEQLDHSLRPDWRKRHQSKRDLQDTGGAFVAAKSLRLVETKPDGTRHPYDLFVVDYDLSCKPDAELGYVINPWLAERMKGGEAGGFFIVNMTRWLALGIKNPRLFPLALRLAALWDKARVGGLYDPSRLRPIEADRLAWECNTLPEGAAMYRAKRTDSRTAKAALAAARAALASDLAALREAGLSGQYVTRKIYGEGFTILPVPPEDYAEACKRAAQSVKRARDEKNRRKGAK